MKITIVFLIFAAWEWSRCDAFMNLQTFTTNIRKCSGHRLNDNTRELINGQHLPMPNTVEAFIGLVENLEILHPEWRAVETVKALLLNFRYDDTIIRGNEVSTRGKSGVSRYYEILKKLFKDPSMGQQFRDGDLTADQRCALFYMISHTVNSTVRPGEDEVVEKNGMQYPMYLREQGVLTMSSQTIHAFALGKVLLGLLAGLERTDPASASQIYNEVKGSSVSGAPQFLDNVFINVLYAATFGDIVSVTREELKPSEHIESFFYGNGFWGDVACPVHYFLDPCTSSPENREARDCHVTYSLIRGATDGYRLGSHVKEVIGSNSKMRLSTILRMYYSGQGFPDNRALSWCNHRDLVFKDLRQEAIDFDKLYSAATDKVVEETTVAQGVDGILNFMEDKKQAIYDEATREGNKCDSRETAGTMCETPTHVISIVDMRAKEQRDQQSEIVGNVTSGMNMGRYLASSVTVYTNLKPYGSSDQLDVALNQTTVAGCAGCAVKHYDPNRANSENELEVFRDLNMTLGVLAKSSEEESGVPAKVVMYFNYGSPGYEYHLKKILDEIRWRNPRVKLLVFGSRKESLRNFADDKDIETSMTPLKMDGLREKVCKVPAQLQYHNCYRRDEAFERGEKFEGFITPRRVQYWMMDPKYFLKSFHIKLIFRALSGEIRVCFSRDYSKIFDTRDPTGAECHKSTGEEVTFYVSNPCHRYNAWTCDPFYFFIEGKTAPENEPCLDIKCRSLDQISFEFRHEGISCNSANSLLAKFPVVLLLALTFWKFAMN